MSQRDMKANNSNMTATAAQTIDHIKKQIAESEGFPVQNVANL